MMRMRMSDGNERKKNMLLLAWPQSRSCLLFYQYELDHRAGSSDISFPLALGVHPQHVHDSSFTPPLSSREHAQRCAHITSR